eukprot:gene9144-6426_t
MLCIPLSLGCALALRAYRLVAREKPWDSQWPTRSRRRNESQPRAGADMLDILVIWTIIAILAPDFFLSTGRGVNAPSSQATLIPLHLSSENFFVMRTYPATIRRMNGKSEKSTSFHVLEYAHINDKSHQCIISRKDRVTQYS